MRLVNCFIPFLALVQAFKRQPEGDAPGVSARLDGAINEARRQARDGGHGEADTEDALFALAAWADEIMLSAPWSGAAGWQRTLLQRRYFNVSNAGVAFFTRLESLGPQQLQVREVYYLCLGMGFGGRYAYDRNQKALTDIKRDNLALLLQGDDGLPGEAGKLMFPDGYGDMQGDAAGVRKTAVRARPRFSALALNAVLIPLALLLVLYGVYHLIIGQMVSAILPQISS